MTGIAPWRITYAMILVLATPAQASAQSIPPLGDRVRVLQADGTQVTGTLEESSASDLVLFVRSGSFVRIPAGNVALFERSLGRQRAFGRNFGLSVAATSLTGGLLSAVFWEPCPGCYFHPSSRVEAFGLGSLLGAILGLPISVIVGLAVQTEQWESVGVGSMMLSSARIQPTLVGGAGLSVSIPIGGA